MIQCGGDKIGRLAMTAIDQHYRVPQRTHFTERCLSQAALPTTLVKLGVRWALLSFENAMHGTLFFATFVEATVIEQDECVKQHYHYTQAVNPTCCIML